MAYENLGEIAKTLRNEIINDRTYFQRDMLLRTTSQLSRNIVFVEQDTHWHRARKHKLTTLCFQLIFPP